MRFLNESNTKSLFDTLDEEMKVRNPKDRRKRVNISQEIEDVINTQEFKNIFKVVDKYCEISRGPRHTISNGELSYYITIEKCSKGNLLDVLKDLGIDVDSSKMDDLQGFGHAEYEGFLNINGIPIEVHMSEGFRIVCVIVHSPVEGFSPQYNRDYDEDFQNKRIEYHKNPTKGNLRKMNAAKSHANRMVRKERKEYYR